MTQADLEMKQSWRDKFDSAMNAPKQALQSMQTPPFAQNSAVNNFGYNTGLAAAMGLGKALGVFGVPTENTPNAGINTDMSQAQSNAIWHDALSTNVTPGSALDKAMKQFGTGFEPNPTFSQRYDFAEQSKIGGGDSWQNAVAQNQFNFPQMSASEVYNKLYNNRYGW